MNVSRRRYMGSKGGELPFEEQYLTIESLSDDNEIGIKCHAAGVARTISWSKDLVSWNSITSSVDSTLIATLDSGEKVFIKGNNSNYGNNANNNAFTSTGNFNVYGNIMSLTYWDDFIDKVTFPTNSTYTFQRLFDGCSFIIDASNLVLPATTLVPSCYAMMFRDCIALTDAPKLPATTLSEYCYQSMFTRCVSLTTSPELHVKSVSSTSYQLMFDGCSNLNKITCLAENTVPSPWNWVRNVSSNGTFIKSANATGWSTGTSGIPRGWTVIDA